MSTAKISPVRSIAIVLSEQCRKENRSEKWVSTSCEIDAEVVVSKRWRIYTLLNVWVESHFLLSLHKELFWCGATGGKFFGPWRILWDGSGYALFHVFGFIFMDGQCRLPYLHGSYYSCALLVKGHLLFPDNERGAWKAVRNEKNKYLQKPSYFGSISIPGVYELLYLLIWMNLVGIHFAIILFATFQILQTPFFIGNHGEFEYSQKSINMYIQGCILVVS